MLENLDYNLNWGVRPVLFWLGKFPIPSYTFFVLVALVAAILVYWHETAKARDLGEQSFGIFLAALIGGVLGAKIPIWVMNWRLIVSGWPNLDVISSGRTIVGGLIGGWLAVIITRYYLGIKDKKGNLFVPAIAIAIFFGRIGCFLRGCCYGIATKLPWGIDFGDGIRRHPTQIYEALFGLIIFLVTINLKKDKIKPGLLFQIFLISYFVFRFLIEFLRFEPRILLGLTLAQIVAVVVVAYNLIAIRKGVKNERTEPGR